MRGRAGAAALLLFAALPAAAQTTTSVPAQLTLEGAFELALRNNPQHLQAANDADVAAAQVRSSYGAFLPSLSANTGAGSSWSRTLSAVGNFGEPLEQPQPVSSETSRANWGLSTGMTIFNGALFANLASARAGERLAAAEFENQENLLRANVTRAYFAAVRADRLVELERELLAFAEEQVQITEEQFRIAAAQQTDVLGARGDLASQRNSLRVAEADARMRRLDLLEQMGVGGEMALELTTELPPQIDPSDLDADALVARALSSSPAVRMASVRTQQADKQASAMHWARWPTVSIGGSYGRGTSRPGLFDAWGHFNHSNQSAGFSLSVSIPIFQGFRTSAQVAQAEAGAEDARHLERQTRIQAEKEVRAAVIDLGRAYDALLLAQEQAELSALRLELAQEQYRAGVQTMTFTSLQQIVQQNQNAQRQALEARFGYQNARILLEEKLGGPLEGGG